MLAVVSSMVFVLAALTVLNLVVCLAIVRRLRAVEAAGAGAGGRKDLPDLGTNVAPFTAATVDGVELTERDLAGDVTVALFSPTCPPCKAMIGRVASGALPVLDGGIAFIVGGEDGEDDTRWMIERLAGHVRVAIVDIEFPDAFDVRAFPSLLRVSDGVVRAAGHRDEDVKHVKVPEVVA